MPTLEDTLKLVKYAHGKNNAKDKSGDTPYYWHLVRVMLRLQTDDIELLQIALLHDVVEDTDITLEKLKELGYSNRVIEGVKWSSKNMFSLTFAQWMKAIGQEAPIDTILLKIADISDNLGFERMRGLMTMPSQSSKKSKIKTLKQRIDHKVEKKMRLHGEMGVFDRYYKGWNFMFENSNHIPLIEKVYLGDFCYLHQLKSLTHYIPQKEMNTYLNINKINTWKVDGVLSIIKDIKDNDYVVIKLLNEDTNAYVSFLGEKISQDFLYNQQKRDRNKHHITVINAMDFNKLKKESPEKLKVFLDSYLDRKLDFFTYGIGTATNKKLNQAWFVVCENALLTEERKKLSLGNQDFHITLAFDKGDVFGHPKNKTSVLYDNKELWLDFLSQYYTPQKLTPKIIL